MFARTQTLRLLLRLGGGDFLLWMLFKVTMFVFLMFVFLLHEGEFEVEVLAGLHVFVLVFDFAALDVFFRRFE